MQAENKETQSTTSGASCIHNTSPHNPNAMVSKPLQLHGTPVKPAILRNLQIVPKMCGKLAKSAYTRARTNSHQNSNDDMEIWENPLIACKIPNQELKSDQEMEVRVRRYVPVKCRGSKTLKMPRGKVMDLPGESPKWHIVTHLQSPTCHQQREANSDTSATQKQRGQTDTVYPSNSAGKS